MIKAHTRKKLIASIEPKSNKPTIVAITIVIVDNTPERNKNLVTPADWNIDPEVDNII